MDPERWRQIEELYQAALARRPEERTTLLAGAEADVRREVESLLAHDSSKDGVLGQPAWEGGASTETAPVALGTRMGTYRIEALIGEVGMGVVYRALDTKLNRPVAIKFLSTEVADAAARRRAWHLPHGFDSRQRRFIDHVRSGPAPQRGMGVSNPAGLAAWLPPRPAS